MARVLVSEKIADGGLDALRAAGHDVDVQLGLSPDTVINRLQQETVNVSGGRLEEGSQRYLVRTVNQFATVDEIGNMLLTTRTASANNSSTDQAMRLAAASGDARVMAALSQQARAAGDPAQAARLAARAFDVWSAISPLSKFSTPEAADIYGLPPHQQPADVYEGPGYEGRGGWAWYTGSAARMLVAAYRMLGLKLEQGEFSLDSDAFAPKGELQLRAVTYRGKTYRAQDQAH